MLSIAQARAPFVRFEEVEYGVDHEKTEVAGYPIPKIVDFAFITPAGSKDVTEKIATEWLAQIRKQAMDGTYNPDWVTKYEFMFNEYKKGNEVPVDGTPIKTWIAVGKAQREQILRANIRTVEELVECNEQAIQLMGMGGRAYKDIAKAYLNDADKSGRAKELVDLKMKVEQLQESLQNEQEKRKELEIALKSKK